VDAILRALKEQFPELRPSTSMVGVPTADNVDERRNIITLASRAITLKDQLHEYMFCRENMSELSLLTFMLDTYKTKAEQLNDPDQRTGGRPCNRRVHYRQGFAKSGRCQIYQTSGHETLPHFLGSWFPRSDRPAEMEVYCASILALLKPWNDMSELKTENETFEQVFDTFVDGAPKRMLDIIKNIQYYYECYDSAKRRRDGETTSLETDSFVEYEEEAHPEDLTSNSLGLPPDVEDVTNEDIDATHDARGAMRERIYAEVALNTALDCSIFSDFILHTVFLPLAKKANSEDIKMFHAWEE
jgi:hypothetical protein